MESSMESSQKTKSNTFLCPNNPNIGCIYKGNEISMSKNYLFSHIYCRITHDSQDMTQLKCSLTEYLKCIYHTQKNITEPFKTIKSCHFQQHG